MEFALTNYREPEKQKPLTDAAADSIAAKEHEFAQDQLSPPQMNRFREEDHRRGNGSCE